MAGWKRGGGEGLMSILCHAAHKAEQVKKHNMRHPVQLFCVLQQKSHSSSDLTLQGSTPVVYRTRKETDIEKERKKLQFSSSRRRK